MNAQTAYSLAIQALFERKDRIQRHTPENVEAIQECVEAIKHIETNKELSQFLDGLDCKVTFKKVDPNCGDKL
jgi:hypothetical protein